MFRVPVKSTTTFPNVRMKGVAMYVAVAGSGRDIQTQSRRTMRYACQISWSTTKYQTSQETFVTARRAVAPGLDRVCSAHMRYTAANAFSLPESGTSPIHLGWRFFSPGSAHERRG
jgi:hypothetical protein